MNDAMSGWDLSMNTLIKTTGWFPIEYATSYLCHKCVCVCVRAHAVCFLVLYLIMQHATIKRKNTHILQGSRVEGMRT